VVAPPLSQSKLYLGCIAEGFDYVVPCVPRENASKENLIHNLTSNILDATFGILSALRISMHELDKLVDAIALKTLGSDRLNTLEIFDKIQSELGLEWKHGAKYQATRRLREQGLIEEVPSKNRDKAYCLTPKGKDAIDRVVSIFREKP
jgi:predicted transcriptional regulator